MEKFAQWTEMFYDRFDSLLAEKGWTMNRLSTECGLSVNTFYKMRVRKALPSLQTIYFICEGLEISLSEFFSFDSPSDMNRIKVSENLKTLDPQAIAVLADLIDLLK